LAFLYFSSSHQLVKTKNQAYKIIKTTTIHTNEFTQFITSVIISAFFVISCVQFEETHNQVLHQTVSVFLTKVSAIFITINQMIA
jgi:uncharacterized protein YqhQ